MHKARSLSAGNMKSRINLRVSLRKKIIIALLLFLTAGGSLWLLNYYKHYVLNQKLQILEKKEDLFNTILEARRYEKNYFLPYSSFIKKTGRRQPTPT